MTSFLSLWAEIIEDSDSISDPIFSELLQNIEHHQVFQNAKDENIRSFLSLVNRLMNENKTKLKGITLIDKFINLMDSSNFVRFTQSLMSTLNLLAKSLDFDMAHAVLSKLLPKCKKVPELNQTIISSIVPKIMTNFIDKTKSEEPTFEEIQSLVTCLEEFHGPCGHFRNSIENSLVQYIENRNYDFLQNLSHVFPLLSSSGGGGNNGEKHIKNWNEMVLKVLQTIYNTTYQLYADICPAIKEDPFDSGQIPFNIRTSNKKEKRVLLKMTYLKYRLINLSQILSSYLRDPFMAVKSIPSNCIIEVIYKILILSPVDIEKLYSNSSFPKEFVFLSAILSSIHQQAFQILQSLISCLGTNLFPEANEIEQMINHELVWIKSHSFEELKKTIYLTIIDWLKTTKGMVGSEKSTILWFNHMKSDINIEKESIEINSLIKPKKKGSSKKKSQNPTANVLKTIGGRGVEDYIEKNNELCELALNSLNLIIPALDPTQFIMAYRLISKNILEAYEASEFPNPFNCQNCRLGLFTNLLSLATHTNPKAPISLSLIIELFQKGKNDPDKTVSQYSFESLSILERLTHPICPSLNFPILFTENEFGNFNPTGTRQEVEVEKNANESEVSDDDEIEEIEIITVTEKEKNQIQIDKDRKNENMIETEIEMIEIEETQIVSLPEIYENEDEIEENKEEEEDKNTIEIDIDDDNEIVEIAYVTAEEKNKNLTENENENINGNTNGNGEFDMDVDKMLLDFIESPLVPTPTQKKEKNLLA